MDKGTKESRLKCERSIPLRFSMIQLRRSKANIKIHIRFIYNSRTYSNAGSSYVLVVCSLVRFCCFARPLSLSLSLQPVRSFARSFIRSFTRFFYLAHENHINTTLLVRTKQEFIIQKCSSCTQKKRTPFHNFQIDLTLTLRNKINYGIFAEIIHRERHLFE